MTDYAALDEKFGGGYPGAGNLRGGPATCTARATSAPAGVRGATQAGPA